MSDRVCVVCQRAELGDDEPQTCVRCLSRTRSALGDIVDLYALLPDELTGHAGAARPPDSVGQADSDGVPDALVLLAGGTNGSVVAGRPTPKYPDGNRDHAADQWETDTPSVVGVLATWEDDWRTFGYGAAQREATVVTSVGFLTAHLSWAAQHHPAFDEFARDVSVLRAILQRVTRDGDPTERGVPCPYCGSRLIRRYAEPDPCEHPGAHCDHSADDPRRWPCRGSNSCACEQGGRRDDWICSDRACGTVFDRERYNLAVWAQWQQRQAG